ncbi:hypothetical protein J2X50_000607 [Aminobacter sp. BE322]
MGVPDAFVRTHGAEAAGCHPESGNAISALFGNDIFVV